MKRKSSSQFRHQGASPRRNAVSAFFSHEALALSPALIFAVAFVVLAAAVPPAAFRPVANARKLHAANGPTRSHVIAGADTGHVPEVLVLDAITGMTLADFFPYDPGFTGGVRLAAGDVTGDGIADVITGPGPGMPSQVKVFDGVNSALIRNFFAFPAGFTGGIFVAAGDVNGDGIADIVASPDSGLPPEVKVFEGVNGNVIRDFLAYDPAFMGGVRVAAGDVNGDGIADIITGPGSGGPPQVKVFDGVNSTLIRNFFAFKPGFTGGIYVAAGDFNGDGVADIVASLGSGAPPEVKVFDGANGNLIRDFLAFDPAFTGGVRIAAADVNGDGIADFIAGSGPGIAPQIRIYDGLTGALIQTLFPFNAQSAGVYVAGTSAGNLTPTPTPTVTPSATPTATATPTPSGIPRVTPTPRPRPTPAPRPTP